MEKTEQAKAPLWDALVKHLQKKQISFHTPGHKGGQGLAREWLDGGQALARYDLTELPGLDNLHFPKGAILAAQRLAALACGAKQSFFLVNGASCGIQAMILATCQPGDSIILPRDCHISVHHAMILAGVEPIYLYPQVDQSGLVLGITQEHLRAVLSKNARAKAVLLLNPNYYGIGSNLANLAQEVKNAQKLLFIDEAHGAHFPYHAELPTSASQVGADLWVQSTHKMSVSLTQSALLHLGSESVDAERVKAALRLVQTTSPSYLLMASLDLARKQMACQGEERLRALIAWSTEAKIAINNISGIKCLTAADIATEEKFSLDPLKLTIDFTGIGLTGAKAADLLEAYQIEPELSSGPRVLICLGPGNSHVDVQKLVQACQNMKLQQSLVINKESHQSVSNQTKIYDYKKHSLLAKQLIPPRAAWFTPSRTLPIDQVCGKISGEFVTTYPPGIPILCPGEEVTPEKAELLKELVSHLKVIEEQE